MQVIESISERLAHTEVPNGDGDGAANTTELLSELRSLLHQPNVQVRLAFPCACVVSCVHVSSTLEQLVVSRDPSHWMNRFGPSLRPYQISLFSFSFPSFLSSFSLAFTVRCSLCALVLRVRENVEGLRAGKSLRAGGGVSFGSGSGQNMLALY